MQKFERLDTIACPLPLANLDTDQLLPARFLKRPRAAGYGDFLLHDLRFGADGKGASRLPLDDPRYRGAGAIVARRNFGSGSSREAAVYALADFGIRCVIAPSFGDIFLSNCAMNGLLTIGLAEAEVEELLALPDLLQGKTTHIDLEAQHLACGPASYSFDIDPLRKTKLLKGWDDIDITLSHATDIARFVATDAKARPWALPHPAPDTD
jgi:3-isopropylmalate/(R)-2-methylmalate dehydratase small subunit